MKTVRLLRRPLSIREILSWADAYREATGKWPSKDSGSIPKAKFETWLGVDAALRTRRRGLPGGSSLAQLLADKRNVRNIRNLPPLTEKQILKWADEHREKKGEWPTAKSGIVPDSGGEKWHGIEIALRLGMRGLPGGSSLSRLLAEHRGHRNRKQLPPLTERQILVWADAHYKRTGEWPIRKSGPIMDARGETWMAVEMALNHGQRGLSGGSSLALFLAEKRNIRNAWNRPDLSIKKILVWIDAFHDRTGKWPNSDSGPIPDSDGESWTTVNNALKRGKRGLSGGFSLTELLAIERGVRNVAVIPRLSIKRILSWARAWHRRTGKWPTISHEAIPESPGDTWSKINNALTNGLRGLPGGTSLPQLLAERNLKRNHLALPPLSLKKILAWADAHHERTGEWPTIGSGAVHEFPSERWDLVDNALRAGLRGLPGGSSLRRLLVKKRGARHHMDLPPLTEKQILRWAKLHFDRTGKWPKYNSGPIADAPGELWVGVDRALRKGKRGLPEGSSLARLLSIVRQKPMMSRLVFSSLA